MDLFVPMEEFLMQNRTGRGQLGDIVPDNNRTQTQRRRRSTSYSRICPAYQTGITNLVAFVDGSGSGQIVNVSIWAFLAKVKQKILLRVFRKSLFELKFLPAGTYTP